MVGDERYLKKKMFIENLDQKRCISVKSLEFISAGINLSNIFLDPFQ